MELVSSPAEMQRLSNTARCAGQAIAFVPTMGALHEGHLSLVRIAAGLGDVVVVSVYVNPIQFSEDEDLDEYPSNLERDRELCGREGVNVFFCPSDKDLYATDHSVFVEECDLSRGLCGIARPGHFRGVTTVVAKLLNLVLPDIAVFGQKDVQQARIIQQMVRDLNFPVRIVIGPTVRESDGLAMSSRNTCLSPEERADAHLIFRAVSEAEELYANGARDCAALKAKMREVLGRSPLLDTEYVETVDYQTLRPVDEVGQSTLVAVAVRIGGARLIDNTLLGEAGLESGESE